MEASLPPHSATLREGDPQVIGGILLLQPITKGRSFSPPGPPSIDIIPLQATLKHPTLVILSSALYQLHVGPQPNSHWAHSTQVTELNPIATPQTYSPVTPPPHPTPPDPSRPHPTPLKTYPHPTPPYPTLRGGTIARRRALGWPMHICTSDPGVQYCTLGVARRVQ